ncbi:MAG: hydrolase [Ignavibacteria bacterium]
MRIKKEHSAGLVIDFQEKLYPHIYQNELIASNTAKLIAGLKIIGIPILVTTQYVKGLGDTIDIIKSSLQSYDPVEKMSFSCCGDNNFLHRLNQLGKEFIIIAGIETHVCVLQTGLDLLEQKYQPIIVEDCVSSRRENDKYIAIKRLEKEGAIITTYESILFELLEISGTETFKSISKIVK